MNYGTLKRWMVVKSEEQVLREKCLADINLTEWNNSLSNQTMKHILFNLNHMKVWSLVTWKVIVKVK